MNAPAEGSGPHRIQIVGDQRDTLPHEFPWLVEVFKHHLLELQVIVKHPKQAAQENLWKPISWLLQKHYSFALGVSGTGEGAGTQTPQSAALRVPQS